MIAQAVAGPLGLPLHVLRAATDAEITVALAGSAQLIAGVLVIGADSLFNSKSQLLAELSLRYAVPAIYQYTEFANAGRPDKLRRQHQGIVSVGRRARRADPQGRQAYRPVVQQSIKVELIVNLKTARALGVTVPLSLLGRADQVIE